PCIETLRHELRRGSAAGKLRQREHSPTSIRYENRLGVRCGSDGNAPRGPARRHPAAPVQALEVERSLMLGRQGSNEDDVDTVGPVGEQVRESGDLRNGAQ